MRRRPFRSRSSLLALLVLAGWGCGADLTLPDDTGPSALTAMAGDQQDGTVGQALDNPITVKVTDRQDQPVAGLRVAFAADPVAGGSVSPDTVTTDDQGLAAADWTLGQKSGEQTATAVVVGNASLAETFTATAAPTTPRTLAGVSGDNQNAPAGSALPEPLVVVAADEFGNPVPGVEVTWRTQGGGSVDPTTSVTDAEGLASTLRVLGPSAGNQGATASAGGLDGSPVAFAHVARSGASPSSSSSPATTRAAIPAPRSPSRSWSSFATPTTTRSRAAR